MAAGRTPALHLAGACVLITLVVAFMAWAAYRQVAVHARDPRVLACTARCAHARPAATRPGCPAFCEASRAPEKQYRSFWALVRMKLEE